MWIDPLVFTVTVTCEVVALARKTGAIVWTVHLPAGCNATLAIAGSTLLAGAGLAAPAQHPVVVAYRLGAKARVARTPAGPGQGHLADAARALVADAPQAPERGGSR